jgi:PAS domain S-box-containing protein
VAQVERATKTVLSLDAERVLLITTQHSPRNTDPVRDVTRACQDIGCKLLTGAWPPPDRGEPAGASVVVLDCGSDLGSAARQLRELRAASAYADKSLLVIYDPAAENELDALIDAGADDLLPYGVGVATLRTRLQVHMRTQLAAARVASTQRSLGVMLEITQALASSIDIQEILYTVVRRIADLVHVDRVSIVLVPDDSQPYAYVVAASDDRALSNLRLDLAKYPEIRHVLLEKQPLTIDDVGTHPVLDGVRKSVADLGLSSLTIMPMIFESRAIGVLFLRAKAQPGALDEEQLGFCQVLANATAIALNNARILQTLHEGTQGARTRQDAEKRLALLKRYADVFESAADGIVAVDEDARLLYANPGAYALLGFNEVEFGIGDSVIDLVDADDRKRLFGLTRAFASGNFPRTLDVRVRCKNGELMVIACAFSRLHGQHSALLLSFRDVTEARRLHSELEHTRNFLQSLIDASVDAIVAADMKGRIILFNGGAERLYGYKRADIIHKLNVRRLYPGDGAREVMRLIRSAERGGVGRLEPLRTEAIDKDGNVFPISLTAATIYEKGEPSATFGIFADLRERVRVEEQLAQAHRKLELSEKQALLAELAGATAHELNQPLTSVMGYADLLMRKLGPESPAHHAAQVIQDQAQRMAEIVRKIGRLTRYETKSYVGEQRILDLDRASEDAPPSGRKGP